MAAAVYSIGGFRRLLSETAFRHELLSFAVVLALFAGVGAGVTDYLTATALFLVLVAVEALNTAIECIVDRVSPDISGFAKQAKDLGSFAVFCMLCANGAFALYTLAAALGYA